MLIDDRTRLRLENLYQISHASPKLRKLQHGGLASETAGGASCKMPDDGGAAIQENSNSTNSRSPAIAPTRSFRFLNLSVFHSKRFASSTAQQQHHHRSGSIESTSSCLTFHSFRDALFCEHPISSSSPCRDETMSKEEFQVQGFSDERKVSRWRRIVGRFGAKKNRVREEASTPKEQKKPRLVESADDRGSGDKWVACGDLSRIARSGEQKEDCKGQYELDKPVLEPMRFVTTDLVQRPERRKDPSLFSQARKNLRLRLESDDVGYRTQVLVTHLRCKRGKEQGVVAAEVRILARDYPPARVTFASLGAIAPLVAMLESTSSFCVHSALLTLYTLAGGNDVNKAAIVDAGVVPKLVTLLQKLEAGTQEAVVANFLSLSALDRNKPLIGSSGAIPELVRILNQSIKEPIRWESLRALYNLSLSQVNIKFFVEGDAANALVEILKTQDANANANVTVNAEKALAVLGNIIGVGIGRKCVTETVVESLIEVLSWGVQFAKCQERAAYILMVVAHQSHGHRQAMVQKRAIPALLEVSLLGSALAQKRAVRILECLREDRDQGLPRPMSAPMGPPPRKPKHEEHPNRHVVSEGSKVVNHMVQQSLEQNLQRIVRRAQLPLFEIGKGDGVKRVFSLSGCSSSKSLPF